MNVRLYMKKNGNTSIAEYHVPYIEKLSPQGKRIFEQKLRVKLAQKGVRIRKAVFV